MKTESGGVASRFKSNPVMGFLIVALMLFAVLIGYMIFVLLRDAGRDQQYLQIVGALRDSSNKLTEYSRDATNGKKESFGDLSRALETIDNNWDKFSEGSDVQTRFHLSDEIAEFSAKWDQMKQNVQVIIDNEDSILLMNEVANTLNEALPELQGEHDNIVEILLEVRAPAEQVSDAQRQSWFAERIGRNVDKMLRGGANTDKAADEFIRDARRFGKKLDALINGDPTMGTQKVDNLEALESLERIKNLFKFVDDSVKDIFEKSPELFQARQASDNIIISSPILLERLGKLTEKINSLPSQRKVNNTNLIVVVVFALLCLAWIGVMLNGATKRRLRETADTNERNQTAILRLLDELADLADGDLTVTATVTEDFTGAIADSINYTIDQLRVLVSRINETSVKVTGASEDTKQTAMHLARASEHQAQEIAGASAAVNEMAVTIDQVSANAAESARVAERAVSIASNGAKVVQNTINGMDTIREQIQDTSKRIKRLGESSQEIGDIVSLINDIADQTNILALNAAIQASMAGDAGRGFAVVADEVQRLAERSATATKQIEALVKTIQNDTTAAVNSMEQTTAEVVRGARLAQDAGVALEEIETVSASLAELIQNISNAARQQSTSAGHISNTMNVIQEFTSQTSAGTRATASAIGKLAQMAIELHESVADFKLPEGEVDLEVSNYDEEIENESAEVASDAEDDDSLGVDQSAIDEIDEAIAEGLAEDDSPIDVSDEDLVASENETKVEDPARA